MKSPLKLKSNGDLKINTSEFLPHLLLELLQLLKGPAKFKFSGYSFGLDFQNSEANFEISNHSINNQKEKQTNKPTQTKPTPKHTKTCSCALWCN